MRILESIAGEVLLYDYAERVWKEIASFSDENVESASCRRQCCADGAFEIGGVYGATLSLSVRLTDVTRNQLRSSKIVLRSKYAQEEDWEPVGEFWVTRVRVSGDLYLISGEDGMLWTDADAMEKLIGGLLESHGEAVLDRLLGNGVNELTYITGTTLAAVSAGMTDVLRWDAFDTRVNGSYGNEYVCSQDPDTHDWAPTAQQALTKPYAYSSGTKSSCPRDFYRWAAELAGGFITIRRDGMLCLRQFGMAELGMAEIGVPDVEWGTLDVSDFRLWLQEVQMIPEVTGVSSVTFGIGDTGETYDFDYRNHAALRYRIENNPLLDGLCARFGSAKPFAAGLWRSFFSGGVNGDQVMQIRPFRATVHKPVRFELGQRIKLPDGSLSTVTSVGWTFRGGHTLACGGENARVAGGRILTKSDRVARDLLYRTR